MVSLKEFVSVCLLIVFVLAFTSARKEKELAALDKRVDKVRRFLLLHAWMESERETSLRSKRATKSRRRAKFRLPYFPLYPMDIPVCKDAERESKSGMCKSWAKSGYCEQVKYVMSRYCPKECKYCKQFSPPGCQSGKHGCCWNNLEARGPNGRGCTVCRDSYGRLCRLFEYFCPKPGKYGQFVRYHCFKTCGWCDNHNKWRPFYEARFGVEIFVELYAFVIGLFLLLIKIHYLLLHNCYYGYLTTLFAQLRTKKASDAV